LILSYLIEADFGFRMGASDNEARGQSTFFVELQETSDILAQVTPNSLVILDEVQPFPIVSFI